MDRPVGRVTYTQFLNQAGGIVADLTVTRLASDEFRVVTGAGAIDSDLGWLRLNVDPRDGPVEIEDVTEASAVIGLWGPSAREVLMEVTDDDLSNEAIPFSTAREIAIAGAPVLAQRITFVGELGFELYVAPEWAVQVWDRIWAAGEAHDIRAGGYRVLESLRIEKGYRYFGSDLTPADTPYEGGVGFCVAEDKPFIGAAALARARAQGPRHRVRTLLVGDDAVPRALRRRGGAPRRPRRRPRPQLRVRPHHPAERRPRPAARRSRHRRPRRRRGSRRAGSRRDRGDGAPRSRERPYPRTWRRR